MDEDNTLLEIIRKKMEEKTLIICREYCKYYDQCYAEHDDNQEDNIFDRCPLIEFFYS